MDEILNLNEKQVLEKLKIYSYRKDETCSRGTPNWRLIVRLLVDGDKSVRFLEPSHKGQFEIPDKQGFIDVVSRIAQKERILRARDINQDLDKQKVSLAFNNGIFRFLKWNEMMMAFLNGQCRRAVQFGVRCTKRNDNSENYLKHDGYHDKTYPCTFPRCHIVYTAFECNEPQTGLKKHLENHSDSE